MPGSMFTSAPKAGSIRHVSFKGDSWTLMDPTFDSNSDDKEAIQDYIGRCKATILYNSHVNGKGDFFMKYTLNSPGAQQLSSDSLEC